MSASELGWYRVRMISDEAEQLAAATKLNIDMNQPSLVLPLLGQATAGGAGITQKSGDLRGYELLRRTHVVLGHAALGRVLTYLAQIKRHSKSISKADIDRFCREGCGACEDAKLKRRPFTTKTITDLTPAQVGKKWTYDQLELRVPSAVYGYTYLGLFVPSQHQNFTLSSDSKAWTVNML